MRSQEPYYRAYVECGAHRDALDGYDAAGDWLTFQTQKSGPVIVINKVAGQAGWDGPTGFYGGDYRSLFAPGETKTWDLWVWTNDYALPGDVAAGEIESMSLPSPGYTGEIVIDYVPPSVDWQGPWVVPISLSGTSFYQQVTLPIPLATDPYDPSQVTRMHVSVTAPVPEPSSLAALSLGLVPIAGLALRQRRRG